MLLFVLFIAGTETRIIPMYVNTSLSAFGSDWLPNITWPVSTWKTPRAHCPPFTLRKKMADYQNNRGGWVTKVKKQNWGEKKDGRPQEKGLEKLIRIKGEGDKQNGRLYRNVLRAKKQKRKTTKWKKTWPTIKTKGVTRRKGKKTETHTKTTGKTF